MSPRSTSWRRIFFWPRARRRSTRRWRRSTCRCRRSWKKGARYSASGETICCQRCENLGSIFRSRRRARFTYMPIARVSPTTASVSRVSYWSRQAWRSHRAVILAATARASTCVFPTPPRTQTSKKAYVGWRSICAAPDAESELHDGAEMGRQIAVGDAAQVAIERDAYQCRRLRRERGAPHAEKARLGHQEQFLVGMLRAAGVEPRRQRVRELLRDGFHRVAFLAKRMPAGAVAGGGGARGVRGPPPCLPPPLAVGA